MARVLIVAGLALVALASNAVAQGRMPKYEPPKEERPLYDERRYKAATDSIPENKGSNDPWAGAREPAPPPGATPTPTATKPRSSKQTTPRPPAQ